ncbi:hypothetical protein PRZ48_013979 [Zasmidium cellare]|uniref:Uncharacterized protein n=1 Tax=Zasmidium cellare TaxID=395010 RepID=A0ABR0E0D6_ZASCE|nr:hypothetical protein PRZ48_013979 [Zasmidium cellare]
MLTPSSSTSSMSSKSNHLEDINAEVLKRSGIQPPSYDSVVNKEKVVRAHRSIIPPERTPPLTLDPHFMAKLNESRDDLSDADEFFELTPSGTVRTTVEMETATEAFVSKWKGRKEERREERRERKEERKAERAARKAEKYRERAEKWAGRANGVSV